MSTNDSRPAGGPTQAPIAMRGLRARLVGTGVAVGLAYWLFDTFTDTYYYHLGDFRTVLLHPPPSEMWMRVCAEALIAIFYGITIALVERHRRAELALQASERTLTDLAAISPVGIFRTERSGRTVYVNRRLCEITGMTEDELLGERRSLAIHPDDRDRVVEAWHALVGGGSKLETECRFLHPDGQVRWVLGQATVQKDGLGRVLGTVGTLTDISERVLAQAWLRRSEELYRGVYSSGPLAIVLWSPLDDTILDWNVQAERLFGWRREEAVGRHFPRLLFVHEEDAPRPASGQPASLAGLTQSRLARSRARDGETLNCEWYSAELHDADGRASSVVSMALDVTDRLRAEEEVRASLREKEVLLREIHHRVKNNLQVIATLLDLQSQHTADETATRVLRESRSRVRTMALIHEKLYGSQHLSQVDLPGYVSDLASSVMRAFGVDRERVELGIDVAPVTVGIDAAMQCGLIVNELMSNSLKYAFEPDQPGSISISMRPVDDARLQLVVADNGRGIPEGIEMGRTTTLGLQLVEILSAQLGADVKLGRARGTRFEITFPVTPSTNAD